MIGSNKDSWMVVRSTSDSKKNTPFQKPTWTPLALDRLYRHLSHQNHRCLFAMFVLWESVGYWCLLYLHFVLGGECFWRADSHEKGSLLHRQVSGFFKVARYWLPGPLARLGWELYFFKAEKHQHWKDRSCMVMANGHTIRKIDNHIELRIGDQLPTTIGLWTMQKMPLKQCARIPQSGFQNTGVSFVGFF